MSRARNFGSVLEELPPALPKTRVRHDLLFDYTPSSFVGGAQYNYYDMKLNRTCDPVSQLHLFAQVLAGKASKCLKMKDEYYDRLFTSLKETLRSRPCTIPLYLLQNVADELFRRSDLNLHDGSNAELHGITFVDPQVVILLQNMEASSGDSDLPCLVSNIPDSSLKKNIEDSVFHLHSVGPCQLRSILQQKIELRGDKAWNSLGSVLFLILTTVFDLSCEQLSSSGQTNLAMHTLKQIVEREKEIVATTNARLHEVQEVCHLVPLSGEKVTISYDWNSFFKWVRLDSSTVQATEVCF